jgi:hypothetical protein
VIVKLQVIRDHQETINILQGIEIEYKANNNLILLWIIYRFFKMILSLEPKDTAYMHGIYYEFWEFFSNFYKNKRSNTLPDQWPIDLKKVLNH